MSEEKHTQSLAEEKADFSIQAINWAEDVTCYYLLRPSGKVCSLLLLISFPFWGGFFVYLTFLRVYVSCEQVVVFEKSVPLQLAFFALLEHGKSFL